MVGQWGTQICATMLAEPAKSNFRSSSKKSTSVKPQEQDPLIANRLIHFPTSFRVAIFRWLVTRGFGVRQTPKTWPPIEPLETRRPQQSLGSQMHGPETQVRRERGFSPKILGAARCSFFLETRIFCLPKSNMAVFGARFGFSEKSSSKKGTIKQKMHTWDPALDRYLGQPL